MTPDARANVTLEIGALELSRQGLVIQSRPYAGFECVIGLTVLKQHVVELSYQPASLRVYDASQYEYSGSGHAVPFVIDQGNLFVTATLVFPEGDPISARLAAGTGGGWPADYLSKKLPRQAQRHEQGFEAVPDFWSGFAGNQPRVLWARLEKLKPDDAELPRPIFFLCQVRGFGGGDEPDGLLCPDFLGRFKLIFDYPKQRLILEAGRTLAMRCHSTPAEP